MNFFQIVTNLWKFSNILIEKNPRLSEPVQFKPGLLKGQLYFGAQTAVSLLPAQDWGFMVKLCAHKLLGLVLPKVKKLYKKGYSDVALITAPHSHMPQFCR